MIISRQVLGASLRFRLFQISKFWYRIYCLKINPVCTMKNDGPVHACFLCLDSAEVLLDPWLELLQLRSVLHRRRNAFERHDLLMGFVEQLFTELLLHSVSPGGQLRPALKHIEARSDRLQNTIQPQYTNRFWNNYTVNKNWQKNVFFCINFRLNHTEFKLSHSTCFGSLDLTLP